MKCAMDDGVRMKKSANQILPQKKSIKDPARTAHAKTALAKSEAIHGFSLPECWSVLVVDDDIEVQMVTRLVLDGFEFLGKKVVLVPAMNVPDALEALKQHPDIAVALIDVVMEQGNSGLELVRIIRNKLGNHLMRIILRTGQPGIAPEKDIVLQYDINDYKEKTELTSQKLQTAILTALRSYRDLMFIEENRNGLERIMAISAELLTIRYMDPFCQRFLAFVAEHLHVIPENEESELIAFLNEGAQTRILGCLPEQNDTPAEDALLKRCLAAVQAGTALTRQFGTSRGDRLSIIVTKPGKPTRLDIELLDVFLRHTSVAFDNLDLRTDIDVTQRELITTLVDAIDFRSLETGTHVVVVAAICHLIATEMGMTETDIDMLYRVAPLHDVGKIAIADSILNKPGALSFDERENMKKHTIFGHQLLNRSHHVVLKTAATLALQHHERWDGDGYPGGLRGKAIHPYARILSVVDVFDALTSERVYKGAWSYVDALEYLLSQRGLQFDPEVIDCFFKNKERIVAIKENADR